MKLTGHRCDGGCGKEGRGAFLSEGTPLGWYTIEQSSLLRMGTPWTFCSLQCLAKWAMNRVESTDKQEVGEQ